MLLDFVAYRKHCGRSVCLDVVIDVPLALAAKCLLGTGPMSIHDERVILVMLGAMRLRDTARYSGTVEEETLEDEHCVRRYHSTFCTDQRCMLAQLDLGSCSICIHSYPCLMTAECPVSSPMKECRCNL